MFAELKTRWKISPWLLSCKRWSRNGKGRTWVSWHFQCHITLIRWVSDCLAGTGYRNMLQNSRGESPLFLVRTLLKSPEDFMLMFTPRVNIPRINIFLLVKDGFVLTLLFQSIKESFTNLWLYLFKKKKKEYPKLLRVPWPHMSLSLNPVRRITEVWSGKVFWDHVIRWLSTQQTQCPLNYKYFVPSLR